MSHKGILIGEKDLKKKINYDSRKPRLQIAVNRDPAHLNIVTHPPGTALQVFAAGPHTAQETIFGPIKHNLGYVPKVFVYFYVASLGTYAIGKYFYAFGNVEDRLTYSVDTVNFSIVHQVEDFLFGADYTSTAPGNGSIRTKYMICSNPVGALTDVSLDT